MAASAGGRANELPGPGLSARRRLTSHSPAEARAEDPSERLHLATMAGCSGGHAILKRTDAADSGQALDLKVEMRPRGSASV